jgi:hypothetical protein
LETAPKYSPKILRQNPVKKTPKVQSRWIQKRVSDTKRKVLPIEFINGTGMILLARYDTGTYENHMSLELATTLGYKPYPVSKDSFTLPNGTKMHSIGIVTASIRFSHTNSTDKAEPIECCFNVFDELVTPVLLGLKFLAETETLSKYTDRLKTVPKDVSALKRMCSVGVETNRISCMIDSKLVFAHADTGSDIALVDSRYVQAHGLEVVSGCEAFLFADGSVGYTQGSVDVLLTLPASGDSGRYSWQKVQFHIIQDCSFDFILDEELVQACGIFYGSCSSLELCTDEHATSLAPIIRLGAIERAIIKASDQTKALTKSVKSSNKPEIVPVDQNEGK